MRRTTFVLVAGIVVLLGSCGSRFIRKEEIQRLSKDYEGVYVLRESVETGNFESLNKGARVRIFFKAAADYVSVYAYPHSQQREEAEGKNILQLFESDFPDKKFSEEILRQRLSELIEEYRGKSDASVKQPKGAKSPRKK